MKNISKISGLIIFTITILSLLGCKEAANEILIWTDPPTEADTLYQNPLFEPDLADPTIIKGNDGYFYAYGTENEWATGITRLIPIVRSKNLVKWEYIADAFATKPTWKTEGGLWAPDVVYSNGTYYLYYSFSKWGDSNPGVGLATSTYPYGPFTDEGKIFDTSTIGVGNCIDPYFIEVGSGRNIKRYLFFGSFMGIYGVELSSDMKTIIGEKFKIAGNGFEASYIYPKDGKYYYFGSSGNCCEGKDSKYHVSVAVATDIKGPYYNNNGYDIIEDGIEGKPFLVGNQGVGWVGPGHNAQIVTDDHGRDFILYHAIDYNNALLPNDATRRPLMMDEVIWVDNWPTIKDNVPSNKLKTAPYFE